MPHSLPTVSLSLLDRLQQKESRLLSWGMVDGFFSYDELMGLAGEESTQHGGDFDSEELLGWLADRALIFELPGDNERYRTRVAEGVRLFARLRQWFPGQDWENAAELVSDFRFAVLPREFPDRCIGVNESLEAFRSKIGISTAQTQVATALLGGEDSDWKLADFQVESTQRILEQARTERPSGTIVCAGTGSGKTLAFYLPTFMYLAGCQEPRRGVSCLALYPRTELLRDQLAGAVEQALASAQAFKDAGKPPVVLAPLYGGVPESANRLGENNGWDGILVRGEPAKRCPYLDCPRCKSQLGWLERDRGDGVERLICGRCYLEIPGSILRLTRRSMRESPPDILFTTTEMLNISLRTRKNWKLFGIRAPSPRLVLLDEVHTYEGATGAQVALTLRRWRKRSGARPHFVGLSATLADAPRFFSELLGLYANQIAVSEPKKLVKEGVEQVLVLRGRPGTATLSTTIQAAMLLRRLMDSSDQSTDGIIGERAFVFTDKLDVTNRLFFNLSDAEGWRIVNGQPQADGAPLASLREASEGLDNRFDSGQSWNLIEEIGHGPEWRAEVARTSGQDRGVQQDADLVVTNASLEVGFDDPGLGGVIQHQAPKDPATYLQRKGRAGRQRQMRPWTVIVLSDFGQDRAAYRSYENLFSPMVPPRYLPIRNRHILRIQASFFFLDWLAEKLPGANLSADLRGEGPNSEKAIGLIEGLMSSEDERRTFSKQLKDSLKLDTEDEAEALLWEPPRSLALSVWPTLLRRLESKWGGEDSIRPEKNKPLLPEHVTTALFADLNLPEVALDLESVQGDLAKEAALPAAQALTEFAPGSASRRYNLEHAGEAHWVAVGRDALEAGSLDLASFCAPGSHSLALGPAKHEQDGTVVEIPVYRPERMLLSRLPWEVGDRSRGVPAWNSQLLASAPSTPIEVPPQSEWNALFSSLEVHTHLHGNPLEARRFTHGAEVSLKDSGPPYQEHRGFVSYEEKIEGTGNPAALGFFVDVDAFRVRLNFTESLYSLVNQDEILLRGQRVDIFYRKVELASGLQESTNAFERRALAESFLTAIVYRAHSFEQTIEDSIPQIQGESDLRSVIPGEVPAGTSGDEADPGSDEGVEGIAEAARAATRAQEKLEDLWSMPEVRSSLAAEAKVLFSSLTQNDEHLLRDSLKATVGGAMLNACQRLCPEVVSNDLSVDIDPGPGEDRGIRESEVWLSETTVGGSGVVEAFYRAAAHDPRRFLHLFEAELEPSDFEEVDHYLTLLIHLIDPASPEYSGDLERAIASIRNAESFDAQSERLDALLAELETIGFPRSHPLVSAISLRLLRPGSCVESDSALRSLLDRRDDLEAKLGLELDGRIAAKIFSTDAMLSGVLESAFPDLDPSTVAARESLIGGMLWPRGREVRERKFRSWNRYATNPPSGDRLLLHALVPHGPKEVEVISADWKDRIEEVLIEFGRGALVAPVSEGSKMRDAILELAGSPISSGDLHVHPRVVAQKRSFDRVMTVFELPEALQ